MPCDSIRKARVELGAVNPVHLKAAMDKLHPAKQWSLQGTKLVIAGAGRWDVDHTTAVKQEVGRQAVMAQAKRFGWSVKEQSDGKLLVQKARL